MKDSKPAQALKSDFTSSPVLSSVFRLFTSTMMSYILTFWVSTVEMSSVIGWCIVCWFSRCKLFHLPWFFTPGARVEPNERESWEVQGLGPGSCNALCLSRGGGEGSGRHSYSNQIYWAGTVWSVGQTRSPRGRCEERINTFTEIKRKYVRLAPIKTTQTQCLGVLKKILYRNGFSPVAEQRLEPVDRTGGSWTTCWWRTPWSTLTAQRERWPSPVTSFSLGSVT